VSDEAEALVSGPRDSDAVTKAVADAVEKLVDHIAALHHQA
jgi:hypothetical protein